MRNFHFILSLCGIKSVCISEYLLFLSLHLVLMNYVREVDCPQANARIYPQLPIDAFFRPLYYFFPLYLMINENLMLMSFTIHFTFRCVLVL
jgi:hypothetical protein